MREIRSGQLNGLSGSGECITQHKNDMLSRFEIDTDHHYDRRIIRETGIAIASTCLAVALLFKRTCANSKFEIRGHNTDSHALLMQEINMSHGSVAGDASLS